MNLFGLGKEKYAAIFVCYLVSVLSLLTTVNVICTSVIGAGFKLDTVAVEGLFYIIMIAAFFTNGFKMEGHVLVFLLCFIGAGALTLAINPDTRDFIMGPYDLPFIQRYTPRFFIYCFSGFVISSCLDDIDYFFKMFEKFSYITVILSLIAYYISVNEGVELQYMTFSYNMLLQVTFLALRCIEKFDWKKFVCALVGIVVIFVAGCRGAVICCFVSILFYILVFKSENNAKKIIMIFLMLAVVLLMFFKFDVFLERVGRFLADNNINSRTVNMLARGEFFEDSGRSNIQDKIIENFNFLGHGIYTDRVLTGSYAHNILYELVYDFGIILGGGLFIWICYVIIAAFRKADTKCRALICALLSTGFLKLFFSGSYLNQEPSLYILLGLCIITLKKKKV